MTATLGGKVVAYVEARMQSEMGGLVQRHGGVPLAAPVLQEVYNTDTPEVAALIEDLCAGRVDVAVLQTGVGTNALFGAAEALGRKAEVLSALDGMTVVARSPKPAAVLRRNGVRIDLMPPEPFTSEDLIASASGMDLAGREGGGAGLRGAQQPADANAPGTGGQRSRGGAVQLGAARGCLAGAGPDRRAERRAGWTRWPSPASRRCRTCSPSRRRRGWRTRCDGA